MLARSEGSRTASGFHRRSSGFFAKYSACTLLMMNEVCRFWPKRKCQTHQLIIVEAAPLQVHDHLRRGVVGNVHPEASVRGQRVHAAVEPVEGEPLVLGPRHAVMPLVVRHIPVEGRIGEDQIDLAALRQIGQDIAAIAHVDAGVWRIDGECRCEALERALPRASAPCRRAVECPPASTRRPSRAAPAWRPWASHSRRVARRGCS